jgi:SNF2 family DNA or RNA helicase
MEIYREPIRIVINKPIMPSDFKIIGLNIDGYVILKYNLENNIHYMQFMASRRIYNHIYFEIINNSPLWNINYNLQSQDTYGNIYMNLIININPELIKEYINTSLGLNSIILEIFNKTPQFINTDMTNKSIVPYIESVNPPKDFKINLYDYQKRTLAKMLQIEKNQTDFTIDYTYPINFAGTDILFDPVSNFKTNNQYKFKIKTTGGVLADEMGLGKTISCIALIASNPAPTNMDKTKISTIHNIEKINSKATVVFCPSHLSKQWETEIRRCNPNFKIKTVLTKTDYNGLTFETFINSDIIITSHQFIMNFKFYPTLYYQNCSASSYDYRRKNENIKTYLEEIISKTGFPAINKLDNPIFEFFNFNRVILDEGHEIFGEMLGTTSLARYMSEWVSNIDSNYYWYVSGTPFINYTGVRNCAGFINLKLEDSERNLAFDYSRTSMYGHNKTRNIMDFMSKEYIWNNIIDKICIRHRKIDVRNQIQIHGYQERLVWLKFTDLERKLYDARKDKMSDSVLQQLCCHPLVVESSKKIFGNVEIDLSIMQDKLIEYHKLNYENYKTKLANLDITRQEYHMLKKTYETHMSESKYLFTILEKMKEPETINEESCSICMDNLDNPTVTTCGHIFCYNCLKMCLDSKKRCPLCKTDLTGKDLLVMNVKKEIIKEESNPLIQKYGSKLGKLVSIIRHLVAQEETRIIVFSQWDEMLNLVGKTLAENEIENCFVKGNVWSRNSAIRKFKAGKNNNGSDNKVIMLSLKNAASGTNLTEATHIFFVEPINARKEEHQAIEGQAIARACRVGQKHKIMLMRILIENSIEENIYRKNYNENVQVSFEEQDYMIEPPEKTEKTEKTETKPKRVVKKKVPVEINV